MIGLGYEGLAIALLGVVIFFPLCLIWFILSFASRKKKTLLYKVSRLYSVLGGAYIIAFLVNLIYFDLSTFPESGFEFIIIFIFISFSTYQTIKTSLLSQKELERRGKLYQKASLTLTVLIVLFFILLSLSGA